MEQKHKITSKQSNQRFQEKDQLQISEFNHLVNVIKQRYISPYKIIYMISQQEADLFKLRNQSCGCCSSSAITIPKDQMTKTQIFLSEAIQDHLKLSNLNKILEQLSEKYQNIVKAGQKDKLKVDDQVQKFLVQKTLSEGFNLHLYKVVLQRLKTQSQNVSNSAMLWATPQTWYAKYPNIPLDFLSGETLAGLNNPNKGFEFENNFLIDYKDNLLKELKLLEHDGKFQELIWRKQHLNIRNDLKIMNYPQKFCFDGSQDSYRQGQITYPNLKRSLLTLRSIPFELNQKLNAYCTLSENNQISYFKDQLTYKVKGDQNICRFSTFCVIGEGNIQCKIISKQLQKHLQLRNIESGGLILVDSHLCDVQLEGQGNSMFLFRSWVSTLAKKV